MNQSLAPSIPEYVQDQPQATFKWIHHHTTHCQQLCSGYFNEKRILQVRESSVFLTHLLQGTFSQQFRICACFSTGDVDMDFLLGSPDLGQQRWFCPRPRYTSHACDH